MQAFGARKWTSGFTGDNVGEHDGVRTAGISPRRGGLRGNKGNDYRPGRTYGIGRTLTFRIPRDRYGNFHPRILAVLRDQEDK